MSSRNKLCFALLISLVALLSEGRAARAEPDDVKTVVLVHGAFADGSSWDKVVSRLQAKGFKTVAVHQPFSSFADDVAATKRAIDAQEGKVILVGHSYGGAVITEAGNHDKVAALVYVAAFGPNQGESINDLGKGAPPPPWVTQLKVDAGGYGWLPEATVREHFAQDLPLVEQKLIASKQGPIALKSFDSKVAKAAWADKPVFYVVATQDHMIDPNAQTLMAKRMNASVTSLPASHVVMLSKPQQVAGVIMSAAKAASPALAKR